MLTTIDIGLEVGWEPRKVRAMENRIRVLLTGEGATVKHVTINEGAGKKLVIYMTCGPCEKNYELAGVEYHGWFADQMEACPLRGHGRRNVRKAREERVELPENAQVGQDVEEAMRISALAGPKKKAKKKRKRRRAA